MPINIGDENISNLQRRYLNEVRQDIHIEHLMEILHTVAIDDDIETGEEQLHPDWISIYNSEKQRLDRIRARRTQRPIERIHRFFGRLNPIDAKISTIDPSTEKIAFLLGAGASTPSPSGIPTVTELLPELWRRARRLDRDQLTSLADYCDELGITDIEDLLTAVQISAFCSRNPRISRLVRFQLFDQYHSDRPRPRSARGPLQPDVSSVAYLQDTLQVLFGLLSNLMLPARHNAGHNAIADYVRNYPETPIMTTNYDCCMDRALINENIPISYEVEFANLGAPENSSNPVVTLIKLHGSLNWFYCETCQKVWHIDIEKTVDDYNNQRGEYPIISVCNECGGQRRGLLVPPHAMKFDVAPPLQPLIAAAASRFERSKIVVVVGFSFADADLYISRMLIKAMQSSEDTKLIIIDPDDRVVDKVRRKFNAQIPDFDSVDRILSLRGDCVELLPKFLQGELYGASTGYAVEKEANSAPATVVAAS